MMAYEVVVLTEIAFAGWPGLVLLKVGSKSEHLIAGLLLLLLLLHGKAVFEPHALECVDDRA